MNPGSHDEKRVTLEIIGGLAFVTLNRADKHNALDLAMFKDIDAVIRKLRKNRQVRAVIVQGKGVDFCTGLDVKSAMTSRRTVLSLLAKWWPGNANLAQRVSCHWRKLPVPVIMVVQGRCWGGGMQIALGGDFRIAHPDASFSIMETKWGLIPDMAGSLGLRELVAKDIALKLTMTADVIPATTALDYGLVTEISDDPLQTALDLTAAILARSPDAVAAIKTLYTRNWRRADWRMLARESYYQVRILLGKNQAIAVRRQAKSGQDISYKPRSKW